MISLRRVSAVGAAVLVAGLIAWAALATALRTPEPLPRGLLLALPALSFAWLAFPELVPRWWLRAPIALAIWAGAFYGAVSLYYEVGGAAPACALAGLGAGTAFCAIALVATGGIGRARWALFISGLVWVVAGSLVGLGVELDLDQPLKRPRPGRWFLAAGVLGWHAPFALLRATRRGPREPPPNRGHA